LSISTNFGIDSPGPTNITIKENGWIWNETINIIEGKILSLPTVFALYEESLGGGVNMKMIWIPGGNCQMGSPYSEEDRYSDEGPVHTVDLDGFWLGETEVTQRQWKAIMGNNLSNFKGDDLPVEDVSWEDAMKFCRDLKEKTGKEYTLPTEAQWEYACRAGTRTRYCFGDSDSDLGEYAWYDSNSGSKTQPVKQKKPNAFPAGTIRQKSVGTERRSVPSRFLKIDSGRVRRPAPLSIYINIE
jgi:formylglycine-generating enzyme required for sulfatase activity